MRFWVLSLLVMAAIACSGTEENRNGGGRSLNNGGSGSGSGGSSSDFNFNVTGGISGGGTGTGASSDVAGSTESGACAEAEITPVVARSPGNLLVIFDRSLSMSYNQFPPGSGQSRFQAVDTALQEGLASFTCPPDVIDQAGCTETLTVGSILFPSTDGLGCAPVDPIEAPTQIFWQSVSEFLASWQTYWANGSPNAIWPIGTPIEEAFQKGNTAINTYWPNPPNQLVGNMAVLFLTDGESTCAEGDALRPPVDAIQQATMWAGIGINTYVVSVANAQAAFNDQVAAAGGTGAAINPADTTALSAAIAMVIQQSSSVTSCTTTLAGQSISDVAGACARGTVRVGTSELVCDDPNGYSITSPTEITLNGSACEALKNGLPLSAKFPCDVLQ